MSITGKLEKRLTRDGMGFPIQALGVDEDTTATANIGATSARTAIPTEAEIVEVNVNVECYIAFGDATVVADANSRIINAGSYYWKILQGQTHIAYIQGPAANSGKISISRAE